MNTGTRQLLIEVMTILLLSWTASAQATIRYVALDGSGTNGQSWATAYRDIQAAISDPAIAAGDEIRIKQGRYMISKALTVAKAVKILGGYSGVNAARDPKAFETIIDGAGRAWHGFVITADAVVDGFTITGASAFDLEGNGGGMYIANCKATVTNCVFRKNYCRGSGAGMALVEAHGTVVADCTFIENTADSLGGGIYNLNGNAAINSCLFLRNEAGRGTDGWGGGIMNDRGSPSVIGCTFTGNLAPYGAGLCNAHTDAYVESCTFAESDVKSTAGGGIYNLGGSPRISRCLFRQNTVTHRGGAILDESASTVISNCILWENSAMIHGGAVYLGIAGAPPATYSQLVNCTLYGNIATRGGAVYNYGTAATLWNCILWGNQAHASEPGICNYTMAWPGTIAAFNCDIQGDDVYPGGNNLSADPLFEDPQQGNFHLRFSSPCIDAGSNVPSIESVDFEGSPRLVDGEGNGSKTVDLGAIEFQGRTEVNRVYGGKIMHTVAYDGPDDATATYIFTMRLETDDTVSRIEFRAPNSGAAYLIPNDPQTSSGRISTFHRLRNGRHQWQYQAQLDTPAALGGYGNGVYRIVFHYKGASKYETQMSFLMPESGTPIVQPMQRPVITSPRPARAMGSPVTVAWNPCTDPLVNTILTQVTDAATGEDLFENVFTRNVAASNPYPLSEGLYQVKCAFANLQEGTSSDGTPFTYGKAILVGQQVEVPYRAVYRFWSPLTNCHFYTIKEDEKNWLITNFPHAWIFEGPVYSACSTPHHAGMVPVYRFWSGQAHFYTIQEAEKDILIKEYPTVWTYEGIAFYVYPPGAQSSGCVPVHRFWNAANNAHFYTAFELEREIIMRELGHAYAYEGIAFYAYP